MSSSVLLHLANEYLRQYMSAPSSDPLIKAGTTPKVLVAAVDGAALPDACRSLDHVKITIDSVIDEQTLYRKRVTLAHVLTVR